MQANRILPSPYFWGAPQFHVGILSLFVKPFSAWETFCLISEKYGENVELLRFTEPPLPSAAPLPRYYPVSKIVTDRDLGSKRNQDGGFFLFHCGMGFTRLVLAGENTVLTSKGSLTYILTPGIILLVFPSNTFVSWWCGTSLREPRAHVVVSTKFHACSCLKPYFNRGLLRCYSIFKISKWSCLFLGLSQRCIKHINIHKIHVQLKYKLIILRV